MIPTVAHRFSHPVSHSSSFFTSVYGRLYVFPCYNSNHGSNCTNQPWMQQYMRLGTTCHFYQRLCVLFHIVRRGSGGGWDESCPLWCCNMVSVCNCPSFIFVFGLIFFKIEHPRTDLWIRWATSLLLGRHTVFLYYIHTRRVSIILLSVESGDYSMIIPRTEQ